jgi:hypothetical protein
MLNKLKINLKLWYSALLVSGIYGFPKFFKDYIKINWQVKKRLASLNKYKVSNPGESFEKYLDSNFWICETLIRAYNLNLHKSPRKLRILDIGTGFGYFPFICNYYGHIAESIDMGNNKLYNSTILALDVVRYDQKIQAYTKINLNKKYDLITAFMICFNGHKSSDLWHIKEWDFFLESLEENNLLSGGKVFLSFNEESDTSEPVSSSLLGYFSSINAKITKYNVSIVFKEN